MSSRLCVHPNNFAVGTTITTSANNSNYGVLVGTCGPYGTLRRNYHIDCTLDGVTNPANVGTGSGDIDGAHLGQPVTTPDRFTLQTSNTSCGTTYNGQVYGGPGESLIFSVDESDDLYYEYYVTGGATLDASSEYIYALAISGDATTAITITSDYTDHWGYANGAVGTEEHPYVITTTDGMDLLATLTYDGFCHFSGKYFQLGNDIAYDPDNLTIDINGDGTAESNYTPIGKKEGTSNYNSFRGHFDGCGHTISGIRINLNPNPTTGTNDEKALNDYLGIFGYIENGAEVTGITLTDTRITGRRQIGGIAGFVSNCTVSNCYVKTGVYLCGSRQVAGIVGYFFTGGTVQNCHVLGDVHIHGDSNGLVNILGGIVGDCRSEGSAITNCTSAALFTFGNDVTSLRGIGGIVGHTLYSTVSNCLAIGTNIPSVTTTEGIGAIVGNNSDGVLDHNYYVSCTVGGETSDIGYGYYDQSSRTYPNSDLTENDGAVPAIALYDSGTNANGNATTITANADTGKNVALYGHTLSKDGTWNTLCLPFGVTIADSPLVGADVRALTSASLANGTLTLNFTEKGALTAIEAGTPYIIRWEKPDGYDLAPSGHDLFSPVFSGVTVSAATPTAFSFTGGKFVGGYAPVALTTSDDLLIGSDHTLHHPAADGTQLNAFRAYLSVPAPIDLPQLKDAVLGKAEPTAASDVNGDEQTDILDITALIDYLTGHGLVKRVVSNVGLDFGY